MHGFGELYSIVHSSSVCDKSFPCYKHLPLHSLLRQGQKEHVSLRVRLKERELKNSLAWCLSHESYTFKWWLPHRWKWRMILFPHGDHKSKHFEDEFHACFHAITLNRNCQRIINLILKVQCDYFFLLIILRCFCDLKAWKTVFVGHRKSE